MLAREQREDVDGARAGLEFDGDWLVQLAEVNDYGVLPSGLLTAMHRRTAQTLSKLDIRSV